jgi:DNA replication protein DnaC
MAKETAEDTVLICSSCGKEFVFKDYFKKMLINLGIDRLPDRCPACSLAHLDQVKAKRQAEEETENAKVNLARWRRNCGMSVLQQGHTFENFNTGFDGGKRKKDWVRCRDYAEKFPLPDPTGYKSLYLYSVDTWGTGKTHLVSAIANRLLDRTGGLGRCPVYFVTEPDLLDSIRATFDYTPEEKIAKPSEESIMQRCIQAPLLILDDLGKYEVKDPAFIQRVLYRIIEGRYSRKLPMVITSNIGAQNALRDHLGRSEENEATFERLYEMCGGEWVDMDGKSFRRQI